MKDVKIRPCTQGWDSLRRNHGGRVGSVRWEELSSGNLRSSLHRRHSTWAFAHLPALLTWLFHEPDSSDGQWKWLLFPRLRCQTVLSSFQSSAPTTSLPGKPSPFLPNDTSNTVKNGIVMNPFVFGFHFLSFVPSPPLFECIFSAMMILYFVPVHTYLSCHCKHQWQSPYSFMYFSFTILFTFHTSLCLRAWGFNHHFSFIPPHFFLCRLCSFLSQCFLCFSLPIFSSGILA